MAPRWSPSILTDVLLPGEATAPQQFRDESDYTVLVHEEFLEWFANAEVPAQQKRARYCLRELLVAGACARRKNVKGAAKGWVRTQLGGTGGSHYYLWWAPFGYPAVGDSDLEHGEVLVRVVRHHDQTGEPLDPGARGDWHVLSADMVHDAIDSELNPLQLAAAAPAGPPIRLVRGYPGSGKTTVLLHAAAHVWGSKALFVTFSNRLALASGQYLRTFAPQETAIDSLTFADLVSSLSGAPPPGTAQPGHVDATLLGEHLGMVAPQLGPWAGRYRELHAELHAHLVGRALPIPFRDFGATSGALPNLNDYVTSRSPVIGVKAAEGAAFAASRLLDRGALADFFPELETARSALDRLDDPLPSRFSSTSVVFVDEVQDLTVLEAMVLLTTVARIGAASGHFPRLLIAGDEAQTVRPTAFGWDWFADLLSAVFGEQYSRREEISLTTSLRSPRSVAALVEATRSHYRLLDKAARPAGMAYDAPEAETDGRVFYCHVPDSGGWAIVEELFAAHTSGQLVYPGDDVPLELAQQLSDVATAPNAKGLDFDLVGVLDAGERQRELLQLVDQAKQDPLAGVLARQIADQFRVAVSRSREDLVLFDGGPESHIGSIRTLMTEAEFDPVQEVEVSDLAESIADDADEVDRLFSWLDEIQAILLDDPERALVKARKAREFLHRVPAAVEVPAPLRRDVHRITGLAAALTANARASRPGSAEFVTVKALAMEAFGAVDLADAYAHVDRLVTDLADTDPAEWPHEAISAVSTRIETLRTDLAPFEPAAEAAMTRWVNAVAEAGLFLDATLEDAIGTLDSVVEALSARPDLLNRRGEVMQATAEAAHSAGDHLSELRCLEELDPPPMEAMAHCLEALELWEKAVELHTELGDDLARLRCLRQIPDLERALVLAEMVDPPAAARLRWAKTLLELTSPELTTTGAPLSTAETDLLRNRLTEALGEAAVAIPSVDSLLDERFGGPVVPEPSASVPAPESVDVVIEPDEPDEPKGAPAATPHEPDEPTAVPAAASDEVIDLAPLCDELGIDLDAGADLCRKLGISTVGPGRSITTRQAARLRRRLETHPLG